MRRNIDTTLDTAMRVVTSVRFSKRTRALDLGCGNGVFLQAAAEVLQQQHPDYFPNPDALAAALTGIEINSRLAEEAKARLTERFGKPAVGWDIRIADGLELTEEDNYDAIIGNPPWVRIHDLDAPLRSELRSKFIAAKGAFDLCYLFIEKAVRLLSPGGILTVIVPRGIRFQPSAEPLRALLAETGKWSIQVLPGKCFEQFAGVDPGVLRYVKIKHNDNRHSIRKRRRPVFGDIATITTGVPTGANNVFLVDQDTVKKWQLEHDRLRPVVRGRNIRPGIREVQYAPDQLVWPYHSMGGSWQLDDLSSSPHALGYLVAHRTELTHRPRLADFIQCNPSDWYRFIDPGRLHVSYRGIRIAMPIVFHQPAFALIHDRRAVVLNSCLEIHPKSDCEDKVLSALNSADFWRILRKTSRVLSCGYRRTSVSELGSVPLTIPL